MSWLQKATPLAKKLKKSSKHAGLRKAKPFRVCSPFQRRRETRCSCVAHNLLKRKTRRVWQRKGCGISLLWLGNDILSQISQACVSEMLLNRSKVESSVCNGVCVCVCVVLLGPCRVIVFFLPPRPKADSLSKQTLSLPWNGKTAFCTDVFMLLFYLVHSEHSCLKTGQPHWLDCFRAGFVLCRPARCSSYIWHRLWSKSQEGLTVGQERVSVCVGAHLAFSIAAMHT